ncbi:MAG: LysM peptidoglycan-binding domain-containing protein [Clostridia bacterium]|nr:LysM peptidoglycan-binding domain-containing protein [Clostridia bacterium]
MIERLIRVAEGEIGVCEPEGDDKYIKYYNKTGGMSFGMNVAWCAIFVTWCKAAAGIDKSVIPHFASCDIGKAWFEKRGLFQKSRAYGGEYEPKRGDIIFFSSGYTLDDSTHVGIVTSRSGNAVSTIEGNTSNKVARRSYSMASKYIIGYGTPAYIEAHDKYVVQKGDSLWKIASEVLGKGSRYTEIMALNNLERTVIYPGEELYLP